MSQRASSRVASSSSSSTIAESYPAPSLTDTTTSSSDTTSIPTLSSLLQQTAESLSSRTKTPPPSKPSSNSTIPTSPSVLSHPSAPTYLSSLLSLPLPSLLSLPKNLSSLSTTLDSDLSSLAFTRYPSFLLSHSSSQNISQSFDSLSSSLSSLLSSTTSLEHATSTFNEGLVKDLKLKRDELSLVRERLEPLEELLEVPLVVRQCIRTGNWNEAISISKRIKDLRNNYFNSTTPFTTQGGGEGILERIEKEVEKELLGLKIKVFESFEERQLKLPGAVRGIGILRKLHLATTQEEGGLGWEEEEGLRIVFLSARWKCFEKELERVESQMVACGIQLDRRGDQKVTTMPVTTKKGGTSGRVGVEENDERTRWIKRWIEIWREIVGETIQIYSEVFLSNTTSTSPASPQLDAFMNPIPSLSPHAPLSLFLSTSLSSLSSTLTSALPSLTSTSSLSSLLTQLTYCSHSFTRHGLSFDLPLQLSHLFSFRILRITFLEWELAGKNWESEWRQGWNKSGSTALSMTTSRSRRNGRIPLKDWLVVPEGVSQLLSTRTPPTPTTFKKGATEGGWSPQPCPTLALLPPLTHFLNSNINSLNALRLLPSREVYESLVKGQGKEFERSSRVLEAFVEAWYGSFVASSTPNLGSKGGSSGASVFSNGGNEEERSEEESLLERERDEEKEVVLRSLSWFGRELLPWLRNALIKGVYAENEEKEGREEDGYVEARKRVERLIAKIEGREWLDPDLERPMTTSDSQGITNGNGGDHASANDDVEKKEPETDLPILEIPAGPLESLESPSKESTNGQLSTEEKDDKPIDFTDEPPLPTDEPSLDPTPTTNGEPYEAVEDSNKPYLVDDVAPPPPVPLSETEVGEQNGFEPEERGDTSKIGDEDMDGLAQEEPPL